MDLFYFLFESEGRETKPVTSVIVLIFVRAEVTDSGWTPGCVLLQVRHIHIQTELKSFHRFYFSFIHRFYTTNINEEAHTMLCLNFS